MNTMQISATSARNQFFTLLDRVAAGSSFTVVKDRKAVAKVVPVVTKTLRNKGIVQALTQAAKGFTYSRSDNPLRNLRALSFLRKLEKL